MSSCAVPATIHVQADAPIVFPCRAHDARKQKHAFMILDLLTCVAGVRELELPHCSGPWSLLVLFNASCMCGTARLPPACAAFEPIGYYNYYYITIYTPTTQEGFRPCSNSPPPLSQALSLQIRWLRLSESPALPCAARFTPLEAKSAVSGRGRFLCCLRQGAQIIGGREGGPLKCDNCSFLHVFKSYFSMPSTPSNNLKPAAGRLLFGKFSSDCF